MRQTKYFTSFIVFCALALSVADTAQAAIILKTKNKKALIYLEGLRTKKGAYFESFDLYGKRKGFVQIEKIGDTKAIGVLKWGRIGKRWSLEPISQSQAIAQINRRKRNSRTARIQRDKFKRKQARRKTRVRRRIASVEREYILGDIPPSADWQSQDVLSYEESHPPTPSSTPLPSSAQEENFLSAPAENKQRSKPPYSALLGVSPLLTFNFMAVNRSSDESYNMSGLGYGGRFFVDIPLNHFVRIGGHVGYKKFSASASDEECGRRSGCFIALDYITAGLNFKLSVMEIKQNQLWLAGEGVLMYPIDKDDAGSPISQESISSLHGAVGGALGMNLSFGPLIVPLSVHVGLYMPPSETVLTGVGGIQAGLAYKL